GDFKYRVPNEENAGAKAIGCRTQTQVPIHLQRGKSDIHSVEERNYVEDEQKGDKAAADNPQRHLFNGRTTARGSQQRIIEISSHCLLRQRSIALLTSSGSLSW